MPSTISQQTAVCSLVILIQTFAICALGQSIRGGGNPYSAQLKTDPVVGTIQGIQRYGRPPRTDRAEGDGYGLYVFPSVRDGMGGVTAEEIAGVRQRLEQLERAESAALLRLEEAEREYELSAKSAEDKIGLDNALTKARKRSGQAAFARRLLQGMLAATGAGFAHPFSPTSGLQTPFSQSAALTGEGRAFSPQGIVFNNIGTLDPQAAKQIFQQPLIQVKLRVVEVARDDTLAVSSTLDYIANSRGFPSFINGNNINNINNNQQNLTGVTRFPRPDWLVNAPEAGGGITGVGTTAAGALINLTSEHINWITRLLATELNGDVITAPELVTLNGQNVEFTAGLKTPMNLGTTEFENGQTTRTIDQFFYKHVGTYVSVTPRIVNWGLHGEGQGQAPLVATEVHNWNDFIRFVVRERLADSAKTDRWSRYAEPGVLVPRDIRGEILDEMKQFTRSELVQFIETRRQQDPRIPADMLDTSQVLFCGGSGCEWKPEDCTIDVEVIVRLSSLGSKDVTFRRGSGDADLTVATSAEDNVRAIANVIQVKSGNGFVMAGLIGDREIEEVAKVPIIGDAPVVGYLFRTKAVNRQKTEVLIFIEATVLDPRPEVARAQSAQDFTLSRPFVEGEFLDNPLEIGIHREGIGAYLPPHTKHEDVFWERLGRDVRRAKTTLDDGLF